jgi:transcription antitermination factor NusA-like protein
VVPASQHRALIGRGGQNLNDLQARTGAQIQFPGSRSYNQVGEPINAAELTDIDPADIVKVSGSQAACDKATEELKAAVKSPKTPRAPRAAPAEEISVTINVPLKYHHVISQQGSFFRQLRSTGVNVDNPVVPQKSAVPTRPAPNGDAPAARIDDDGDDSVPDLQWQVIPNYQDAEEGDSEWTLRSRDQEALDRAQKRVEEAIENAAKMTHVGFLTMPDNSMFPRIVGTKGSNVQRLRDETGADITLGKNDPTITIIGSESALEHAREEIIKMTNAPRGGRGRRSE